MLSAAKNQPSLIKWILVVKSTFVVDWFVPEQRRLPGTPTKGAFLQQKSPTVGEAKTALR
jgi:hypothetical protein